MLVAIVLALPRLDDIAPPPPPPSSLSMPVIFPRGGGPGRGHGRGGCGCGRGGGGGHQGSDSSPISAGGECAMGTKKKMRKTSTSGTPVFAALMCTRLLHRMPPR